MIVWLQSSPRFLAVRSDLYDCLLLQPPAQQRLGHDVALCHSQLFRLTTANIQRQGEVWGVRPGLRQQGLTSKAQQENAFCPLTAQLGLTSVIMHN